MGAKECAKRWEKNVVMAQGSEPVKESFVDAVFTLYKRVMSLPATAALLLAADNTRRGHR